MRDVIFSPSPGIATMAGRLAACAIAQIPNLKALVIHNVFLVAAGVSCICVPLCHSYISMAVTACGYGFFMGELQERRYISVD